MKRFVMIFAALAIFSQAHGETLTRIQMSGEIVSVSVNEFGEAYAVAGSEVLVRSFSGQTLSKNFGFSIRKVFARGKAVLLAKTDGGLVSTDQFLNNPKELPALWGKPIMVKDMNMNSIGTVYALTDDGKVVFLLDGFDYWNQLTPPSREDGKKPEPQKINIDYWDNAWVSGNNLNWTFDSRNWKHLNGYGGTNTSFQFFANSNGILWLSDSEDGFTSLQKSIKSYYDYDMLGACYFLSEDEYRGNAIAADGQNLYISAVNSQGHGRLMKSSDAFSCNPISIVLSNDFWATCSDGMAAWNNYVFVVFHNELVVWQQITKVEDNIVPSALSLEQNYPNPFNPSTMISYKLAEPSDVNLSIFDVLGKLVVELVNEYQGGGEYRVVFNATSLPVGTYFYRLQTNSTFLIKKMTLVR